MFERIYWWWQDNGWLVGLLGLIFGCAAIFYGMWYVDTHQKVVIDNIEVLVSGGRVSYEKSRNQFFASNELGVKNMTMNPDFTLLNMGKEPREVEIHSLSAWKVPVSGKVYLEPGQKFKFQINTKWKHWYCWINPVPRQKAEEKNI